MAVYRFKIIFDDQEDTVREIEILGKQTFEEFHRNIQEAIGFDNSKEASFFMSDDSWKKGLEITTRKLSTDDDDDDDDYRRPANKMKPKRVQDEKIAPHIDDPHQKIIYVFDPSVKWTLLIELVKITSDEPKVTYPRTVKSVGLSPKQYKQTIVPPGEEEDDVEDEEDKKAREKVFVVEEGYDDDAADGAEEEKLGGPEEETVPEDAEEAGESGEDEEEATEDFDALPDSEDY